MIKVDEVLMPSVRMFRRQQRLSSSVLSVIRLLHKYAHIQNHVAYDSRPKVSVDCFLVIYAVQHVSHND